MKKTVRVYPGAKINQIQDSIDGIIKIHTTAKAVDGEANKKIIQMLADFFQRKKYQIKIVSGEKQRKKIIEILDSNS